MIHLPELSIPVVQCVLLIVSVIGLALCVEAAVTKKYEIKDEKVMK